MKWGLKINIEDNWVKIYLAGSVPKGDKELEIIKGMGHGFKREEDTYEEMTDLIADWFKNWLK